MKFPLLAAGGLTLALLGAAHAADAKITPAQAKAAAVKKMSGKALSAKYEFEDGRWQYAVLVQKGKDLYEVEVSAKDGRVLDTEKTSMAEEKAEAEADKKAAAGKKATTTPKADTEKGGEMEKSGPEKDDDDKK